MDPRYQEIIRRRAVRASTPSYLSRAAGELGEAAPSLAGFVSVFLYRTGSDVEPLVGRAADGDQAALNELLATARAQQARLSQLIAAGPAVLHLGLVADVRYGGRTLRQGLALPAGVDMVVDQYTFAGGALDADRFELLEYAEPAGTDDYGALVVAAPAELSDLERQIVDRLPPELTELSISPHDEMWPNVFAQAIDCLAPAGIAAFVAAPREPWVPDMMKLLTGGKRLQGIQGGDADPQLFIPMLVDLWQAGRFPFDRLIRRYPFAEIGQAFADCASGATVKPVLDIAA